MFKVISGKRYDTSTAKELCYWTNGKVSSDFNWAQETLYLKKTGEYFLHGEGGPMTKYAEPSGNGGWGYGEKIMPISVEAAQKWVEKNLDGDVYEKIFGQVAEDETRRVVTYSLPVGVIEKIREEAEKKGLTMSDVIAGKFI